MNVTFYNFSKRRNSTKKPTSTGTVVTCQLKEPCSLKNPRLLLSGNLFTTYDYAYIGDFGRYYFVSDVVSVGNGLTEITLEDDVLASHKTAIGSTVARIAFASTGFDSEYCDNRINCSTAKSIYEGAVTNIDFLDDNQIGYFILSVVNQDPNNGYGFATTYALNAAAMASFRQEFSTFAFPSAVKEMFGGNMMNAIVSCVWVPFTASAMPTGASSTGGTIDILDQTLTVSGNVYRLPADTSNEKVYSVTIPDSGNSRYTDFRRIEPYTTGQIFLPGIGCADLCMADWMMTTSVDVDCVIDFATGDISYFLRNPNNHAIIQSFTTNVAADCPVGHVTRNMGGAVTGIAGAASGIVTTAIGIATENPVMAIGSAVGAIGSAAAGVLSYNKRALSLKGGITGKTGAYFTGSFINLFQVTTEDPDDVGYISRKGRPVCLTHAISNHSGYVQCDGASVSIAGDAFERDEINSFLNNGFFYE